MSIARMNPILFRLWRLAAVAKTSLRCLRMVCHIIYGMLLVAMFPVLGESIRRNILRHWSRKLLEILRVGLETHGLGNPACGPGRLFVANHISWLDAVALNAVVPARFIAKSEVRDWPLLGWMCRQAGTLFIKRDTRLDAVRINCHLTEMLRQGESVTMFPEGTTTDGAYPGHFHSALLRGPIDAGATVHPVAIRYHDGSGETNGDAAYVADMTFIQSLWKILRSHSLHVTLVYLPALSCAGKNRRMLASEAQGCIHTALALLSRGESVHTPDGAATSGRRYAAQSGLVWLPAVVAPSRHPNALVPMARAHFITH